MTEQDSPMRKRTYISIRSLGPGLLFAATSVGLSHLVQSTRAGAMYGLSLFLVIILANVLKYPAFRFGSDYSAATGMPLIEGYRRQGKWALIFFLLTSPLISFFAVSAISLITAAIITSILELTISASILATSILVVTAVILTIGRYKWLEKITKFLVVVFSITTLVATALAIPDITWGVEAFSPLSALSASELLFIAALIGFMPSPIDASVWQSLWTCAKARNAGRVFSKHETRQDFMIGYIGCAVLALCFLILGAGLMHSRGVGVENGALAFTTQLVALYVAVLGTWVKPVIAVVIFAIMYSSLLAGLDAVSRSLDMVVASLSERNPASHIDYARGNRARYIGALAVLAMGPLVLGTIFVESLTSIVDLGASIAFVSAPILAYLNLHCIQSTEVPVSFRPSHLFLNFSRVSIVVLMIFAITYLYVRFLVE